MFTSIAPRRQSGRAGGDNQLNPQVTLCLAIFAVKGALPQDCKVNCGTNASVPIAPTVHISTGCPPAHHLANLDANQTARIDSLTLIDQELYKRAFARFLFDVRRVENLTGVALICKDELNAFQVKHAYLGKLDPESLAQDVRSKLYRPQQNFSMHEARSIPPLAVQLKKKCDGRQDIRPKCSM